MYFWNWKYFFYESWWDENSAIGSLWNTLYPSAVGSQSLADENNQAPLLLGRQRLFSNKTKDNPNCQIKGKAHLSNDYLRTCDPRFSGLSKEVSVLIFSLLERKESKLIPEIQTKLKPIFVYWMQPSWLGNIVFRICM